MFIQFKPIYSKINFILKFLILLNKKAKNKLKSAMMSFIAINIISNQEKDKMYKTFKALDKDGDGMLDKNELIEGIFI